MVLSCWMFFKPELDSRSEVPIYKQLHDHMRELIYAGRLSKGQRLPATRELAGLLGLNRTTVSAAYALLESEGLITGHVGRGSFVAADFGNDPGDGHGAPNWDLLLRQPEGRATLPTFAGFGKDAISFAASRPAEELFPLEAFCDSCREVMASGDLASILQLGAPSGYEPLRRHLLDAARQQGLAGPADDLAITNGCQQALDLIGRVLLQRGDKAAVEDPVYPGLKNLLAEMGAQLIGIPLAKDGIDLESLERALQKERPKLLVLTSNFQNPTGATLPMHARKSILRLTRAAGVVLVENDLYGELRYEGEPLPSIKRLDESGNTILLRSFSKITFPGLRVGWVVGPRPLIARLTEAKQLSDLHTDQFSQAVLLRFVESGRLGAHRARVLEAGAERLRAVLAACERYLPAGTRYTRPQGGMNLWVRLPEPLDAGELQPRAQRENVLYVPGKYFAISRPEPGALRLSFASLAPEKIRKGVAVLGEIFGSELERVRSRRTLEPVPAMV
jgi:2-aminoadipate transaminase